MFILLIFNYKNYMKFISLSFVPRKKIFLFDQTFDEVLFSETFQLSLPFLFRFYWFKLSAL